MVKYTNKDNWNSGDFNSTTTTQIIYLGSASIGTLYLPYTSDTNSQNNVGIGYTIYLVDTVGTTSSFIVSPQIGGYINGSSTYSVNNPAFTTTIITYVDSDIWSIINTSNISSVGIGSGYQGPTGPQGDQGLQGNQGPQGGVGNTGSIGPQGPTGLQGAVGPQGNQGPTGPQGDIGSQGNQGPTGPEGPAASTASFFSQGGNSFGATATFGTIDNQNIQINLRNSLVARFLTQSTNATTGPGSSVVAFMGNTATASGVLTPLGVSNVWIQGITTQAANTALLTTFNSGSGGGVFRPHIRMINGAGQAASIGMLDNSQSIVFGRNSDTFLTLGSGGSTFNVSASSAAQNSVVVQASHQNSSGTSVALLVNNTGSNSSTGGVTSFRINNTETLSGSGTMLLMDAQRNSLTVFRIDMSGSISAGTVSNATQSSWKLGKPITAASTLDTTRYMEISVDGTTYKLALIS